MAGSETKSPTPSVLGEKREFVLRGDVAFVGEQGHNDTGATYQTVDGAPVERESPLGYNVGWWTALFLNVSTMVGTGIFSTPSAILAGTGSVGLSLIYWFLGYLISIAGVSVYLELASYFPSRSGGEVVYLEQAFPRPRHFFPVAFAFQTIVLTFMSSNAYVIAFYIFRMAGRDGGDWETKGVALAALTVVCLIVAASNKLSLRLSNTLGVIKVGTLLFITITGWAVLGGAFKHKVADPHANFRNAFKGTTKDGYGISNALVNIIFSYGGSTWSFNLSNEVKNPVRTLGISANAGVTITFILYLLVNIAYFAAVPRDLVLSSRQTTATLYFSTLFSERAARILTILPILSAIGNIIAGTVGHARMVREIGRQGVLPWTKFWVSTWPLGTPGGAIFITWLVSVIVIVAPPAGAAFNFIIALQNYPNSMFLALMTAGLFLIRRQRARAGLPRSAYRSWTFVVVFYLLAQVFLLVMPWVPPQGGINNSSFGFFYAASSITGIGLVSLCFVYYSVWVWVLPRWGKYKLRSIVVRLEDGSVGHSLIHVPNAEVAKWDASHDPAGNSIRSGVEADQAEFTVVDELKA
ncbi:hypothetical protein Q8F55_009240 [Vanrija albida]|uniref:Amino acid permease/ SLC12A domain-containing protein n=1 Tax=Vanrija albida TaxID=181172 RepID=A0ABR3PTC4_9TREE